MGEKRIGSGGFADAFVAPGVGRNVRLERIDALFDWERLSVLLKPARSRSGRKGYPALSLFKALLLQQWYGLSDPGLEEALLDRLSFRRFCGFTLEDETPDETTFVRFRAVLSDRDLSSALFDEVTRQLEGHGLILKTGTLIDASLVEASVNRPAGVSGERSTLDPDAEWTRQYRAYTFGYKAHIAVDQGSNLVRRARMTPARTYESEVADELIMGDESAVYADKAYEHKVRRKRLRTMGIKDRIMHRANKYYPITRWQQARNRLIIPIRSQVEKLFGTLKRSYGLSRARYRGLSKNAAHLNLMCMALNMRRAEVLSP